MRIAARSMLSMVTAAAALFTLAGCTPASVGHGDGAAGTVALLLPESQTTRYEASDRPYFEARLAELCPDCAVVYANADGDPAFQQEQAESALSQGVDVLVLSPVDGRAAASIVASAAAQGVPVISYDRLIASDQLDFYVSFDNEQVGAFQGDALVAALAERGTPQGAILMVHGSPTDPNAAEFKEGARQAIEDSGVAVLAEFDTPDWSPHQAQDWVSGQVVQYGDRIDGVYAANDGTAGGAIAAMKAEGIDPVPPVTGQDAELSAIQRIVAGDQYMTVYKAIKLQAETAADAAFALIEGQPFESTHEVAGTPAVLLDPVAVTVDTILDTVVADGFYTVDEICTPEYAADCAAAGIE